MEGAAVEERSWHVDRWPPLSWAETIVKLAAFGIAYTAFATAVGRSAEAQAWDARSIAKAAILGVPALGLVVAIWDRWRRREVASMAFVLLSNAAHWGLPASLLRSERSHPWLVFFVALMWAGDPVKVLSFHAGPFPVRNHSRAAGTAMTGVYVTEHTAIILLESL
jgi:hypothetical protein